MKEVWRSIKGYEGYYEASNLGNIRSVERTIILKTKDGKDRPSVFKSKVLKLRKEIKDKHNWLPRYYVHLSKDGKSKRFYVHRLVAQTFIENPDNLPDVNHINGNPLDNRVENLEWITKADNLRHAFENNLIKTQKPVAKMDKNTGGIIEIYKSESEACRQHNVTQGKILRSIQRNGTCRGFKWKYINENV